LSLLGALGCGAVMFLINAGATVLAAVIVLGIYLWLERREIQGTWGDVRNGLWMSLVRTGLFQLETEPDAKNWRPHMLVFSGAPTKRPHLTELATDLTHNRGVVTVASVLPAGSRSTEQQDTLESTIREYLEKRGMQAFVRLVSAPDPFAGMEKLVEAYGIGPLVPNTVLVGDTENRESCDRFCQMVATCHNAKRNVLIFRSQPERYPSSPGEGTRHRRIDVWWGGLQANGGLMLILAYLLRTSWHWRDAEVCLNLVVPNEAAKDAAEQNLHRLVKGLRIGAVPRVILANGRPFDEILAASSATADLVFLGLATPGQDFTKYYLELKQRTASLSSTIFVLASENLEFADILQKD
jgi:hypothetical protein